MTVLDDRHDDRHLVDWSTAWVPRSGASRSVEAWVPHRPVSRPGIQRPVPKRPAVAGLPYRGTGVPMSYAPHTRRQVSTSVTVALAGLAALITLWLGSLAQSGLQRSAAPAIVGVPDQLAVVQVHPGETLQQLAGRVAPGAPVGQTVERIRDLNKLDSTAVNAGRTLIAPLG